MRECPSGLGGVRRALSTWLSYVYNWLFSEFLTHLGFLLALVLMAGLLRQRRSPSSTIAWLLVILLAPYIGVPLYIMLGGRKMKRMARRKEPIFQQAADAHGSDQCGTVERLLASYGVPHASAGNRVELVTSGVDAYQRLMRLVDQARSTINITTYILGKDDGSQALVNCLTRRAAEGVSVRLLLDDVGSWRVRRRSLAPLIEAGGQVAYFMPMLHIPFRGRANLRNHRKLVIIDSKVSLAGGMNLAWPYIGPPGSRDLWRDLSMVIEGPAVSELEALFASDWRFTTGRDPTGPSQASHEPQPMGMESGVVQVVPSGPDVAGDPLYESLLALVFAACDRIWIVTPYFVPDEMLARALTLAARRGVDVRLIVPQRSNHITADLARAGYLRDLLTAGARVFLYTPVMLHAKAVVFDDHLAVIGSANMDMRSLFLNYEVALYVSTPAHVNAIADWAHSLLADTKPELPTPGWERELFENVVRLLSPLL
jgi:cardiolipin synthase A/B